MDDKYLNCFIDSVNYAFSMFLGTERPCSHESIEILREAPKDANLHVFIGLTGDLYGTGLFSFIGQDSLALASALCGMELLEHNELSISALKEILNISAGGAATRLTELGRIVDVTPPTIVSGESLEIQTTFPLISVRFRAGEIPFRLSISIKERQRQRILIVDDSELFRTSVSDLLAANGMEVVGSCKDGNECLLFLEKEIPEIVLLDIKMPGTNGLDILKFIKDQKLPTKVVILTGIGDPKTVQKAASLGADGFVLKPVDKNLVSILKHL